MGGNLNFRKVKKLKVHRLKTWQLLLACALLLFLDATLLRFDNLKMVELRDAVLQADAHASSDLSDKLEEPFDKNLVIPCVESKVFGIGVEAFTSGSAEFSLSFAATGRKRMDPVSDRYP